MTSGPADPARCGRYDYVHVRGWTADGTIGPDGQATNQITVSDDRRWAGDDGSARVVSIRREDPAAPPATSSNTYPPGQLPTPLAGPLDTDPGTLATTINTVYPRSKGGQSGIRAAAEIYTWHLPSRDQRAAIVKILADRHLIWRGTAVDRQGRPGVAVSADSDRGTIRDLLILDPHSGAVLAYEQLALRNPGLLNGPVPPVLTYRIYLDHHRQDDAS
ncbi:hypothetical protein [Actinoplanes sp. ATCC 53533]|uniref:hypothetical protein n=1 Tax=Actinoplanes sp. ATCC 53533 TaxID=1288362 RepID=UPI000F77F18D|nr:hypothetical protein [Actinoplanes sp. ATCC 53533]